MQEIIIALTAGFFIGHVLHRLMSGIVHTIREKEASFEPGTIVRVPVKEAPFSERSSENGLTVFREKYLCPRFGNDRYGKCPAGRRGSIILITSLFCAVTVYHFGMTFTALAVLLSLCFLILLGFIDAETGYLPDCLTYPFLWAGLLVNVKSVFVPLQTAVISAASVYLVCEITNASFRFFSGKDGMGHGDFKMIAALGAWFGWVSLIFIVIMASLLAILAGLVRMMSGRQGFNEYFPFGPYLAAAAVPVLLFGRMFMQNLNDFS